jgi:cytochrome bd-type quinol oxidase subunit 2
MLAQLLKHENDSRQARGEQAARAALVTSLQSRSRAAYRTAMVLLGAAMILLVALMVAFTGESNSQGMDHPVMRVQMPLFVLAAVFCGASFQKWQALEQQIHLLTIINDLAGQVETLKKGGAV